MHRQHELNPLKADTSIEATRVASTGRTQAIRFPEVSGFCRPQAGDLLAAKLTFPMYNVIGKDKIAYSRNEHFFAVWAIRMLPLVPGYIANIHIF